MVSFHGSAIRLRSSLVNSDIFISSSMERYSFLLLFSVVIGDFTVRVWDIDTSDNFVLPMARPTASTTNDQPAKGMSSVLSLNWSGMKDADLLESSLVDFLTISALNRDNDTDTTDTTIAGTKRMEVFTCIAYCASNQTLCAGTNQGRLFTWKRIASTEATENLVQPNFAFEYAENSWQLHNISSVRGAVKHCAWGVCDVNTPCVMLNCISNVYILKVGLV